MPSTIIPRRGFIQGGSALLGGGLIAGRATEADAAIRRTPNRTQRENARPSNLSAPGAWAIQGARSSSIAVFAGPESIERGSPLTLRFSVMDGSHNGAVPDVLRVDIYRMGWYGGDGARLVTSTVKSPIYKRGFVVPNFSGTTVASGLPFGPDIVDYSNWFGIQFVNTLGWETGMYVAKVTDRNGAQVYAYFVVRPPVSNMAQYDILVTLPFNTYHAYNNAFGSSVYGFNTGNNRACGVSHNRPLGEAMTNPGEYNNMLRSEYAMVTWLEQQGYAVAYISDTDFEVQGYSQAPATPLLGVFNGLTKPRALLVGGHSEYWSVNAYDAFMTARDMHNTHLMFLAGNSVYWRVHFENRVMYCFKESWRMDTSGRPPTNLWRSYPNNRPENQLLGVMHVCDDDIAQGSPSVLSGPDSDGAIGWEWDTVVANSTNPIPAAIGPGENQGTNGVYDRYESQGAGPLFPDYDVGGRMLFANQVPVGGDLRTDPLPGTSWSPGQPYAGVMVGMKFRVTQPGTLVAARYWRAPGDEAAGYLSLWYADPDQNRGVRDLIDVQLASAYGPRTGWWTAEFGLAAPSNSTNRTASVRLEPGVTYLIAAIVNGAYYGKAGLLANPGQDTFDIENLAPTIAGEMPVRPLPGITGANQAAVGGGAVEIVEGSLGCVYGPYISDDAPAPQNREANPAWYFVDVAFAPDGTVPGDTLAASTAISWPSTNGRARTFASGSIYWAFALAATNAGDLSDGRGANGAGIQAAVKRQLGVRMGINPGPATP